MKRGFSKRRQAAVMVACYGAGIKKVMEHHGSSKRRAKILAKRVRGDRGSSKQRFY